MNIVIWILVLWHLTCRACLVGTQSFARYRIRAQKPIKLTICIKAVCFNIYH